MKVNSTHQIKVITYSLGFDADQVKMDNRRRKHLILGPHISSHSNYSENIIGLPSAVMWAGHVRISCIFPGKIPIQATLF